MAETPAQFFPEVSPKQASTEQGIETVAQDVNRTRIQQQTVVK